MIGSCRTRKAPSSARTVGTIAASRPTSLPRLSPKPPGSMKSRCMSITIRASRPGSATKSNGCAVTRIGSVVSDHVGADRLAIGPLDRRLVDDAAFADHHDAVGDLQDLIEVVADQQHRGAAVARLDDLRADLGG